MPSLLSFSYLDSHADCGGFTPITNTIMRIGTPANAETIAAATTGVIDMHANITLNTGALAFFGPYENNDVAGTSSSATTAGVQLYKGTGASEAFTHYLINHAAALTNQPSGSIFCDVTVFKTVDLKHVATGF